MVHLGVGVYVPASQPYLRPLGSHQNLESHETPFIHLRACFTGCFWFPVPPACHGGQIILSSTALPCFLPQWPLSTKAFSVASLYSGLPQPPAPATHYYKDCFQLLCCPLCPHPEAPTGLGWCLLNEGALWWEAGEPPPLHCQLASSFSFHNSNTVLPSVGALRVAPTDHLGPH